MLWSLSPGTIVGEVLCVAGNLVFAKQIGFGFASRTWWCLFWPVCSKLLSGFAHECSEAWSHLARANGRFDWWQRPGQLGQFSSAHQLGQKSGRVKELKSLLHLVASCCILLHTVASLCYFGNMMFMACVQNETKFFTMVYGPASCCILLHLVASCCIFSPLCLPMQANHGSSMQDSLAGSRPCTSPGSGENQQQTYSNQWKP